MLLPPKLRLHLFTPEGVLPSSVASEGETTTDSQPSMAGTLAMRNSGTTPEKSSDSFRTQANLTYNTEQLIYY